MDLIQYNWSSKITYSKKTSGDDGGDALQFEQV